MKGAQGDNEIVSFAFGKTLSVILLAISLLAVAKNTGVVSASGFLDMLLDGYQSVVEFFLRPLGWIEFQGFDITDPEKSAISLVVIIITGLSAWIGSRGIRWLTASFAVIVAILIFGFGVNDIDGPELIALAALIPLSPILLLGVILRGLQIRMTFLLPLFLPIKKWLQRQVDDLNFRGLITVRLVNSGFDITFRRDLITLNMVKEYLVTVAASLFVIFAVFAAGLISLVQ